MTKPLRDVGSRAVRNQVTITLEERRFLCSLVGHMPIRKSAKILQVGVETMMALLDPCGRVSPETAEKIRQKLATLAPSGFRPQTSVSEGPSARPTSISTLEDRVQKPLIEILNETGEKPG